jgi:hypothetical protein
MTTVLTFLAVYATIGVLWAIVMLLTFLDDLTSWLEVTTCATLNMVFWPLTLVLYLAKKT